MIPDSFQIADNTVIQYKQPNSRQPKKNLSDRSKPPEIEEAKCKCVWKPPDILTYSKL